MRVFVYTGKKDCNAPEMSDLLSGIAKTLEKYQLGTARSAAEADVILAVGGDGTILHAAWEAIRNEIPVVGVNAGRFGFLANIERDELDCLGMLAAGSYETERRMLLEADGLGLGEKFTCTAINDLVLSKADAARTVELEIRCAGKFVHRYRSDGVVFATPIGSTAYSMSAGGPVVDPSVDAAIMTPVCAHSMFTRPVVFSAGDVIRAEICDDTEVHVVADGIVVGHMGRGDSVEIRRSDKRVSFLNLSGRKFNQSLYRKFTGRE